MAAIKALSISARKGMRKENRQAAQLVKDFGLADDAHGGAWHRQVSLLAQESIDTMRARGLDVNAGNFAENITTEDLDLAALPVGSHLHLGDAELIVSQLGKICHNRCAIFHQAGDCVMPREGIFAVVRRGGTVLVGDTITVGEQVSPGAAVISTAEILDSAGVGIVATVNSRLGTAFTRLDPVTAKLGGTLPAILDDLVDTQAISRIIIVDPSGGMALAVAGWPPLPGRVGRYQRNGSTIDYCRSINELAEL